jgi:glutaredoxin
MVREGVVLYVQPGCMFCRRTEEFLRTRGVEYTAKNIVEDEEAFAELERMGTMATPVTVIGGEKRIQLGAGVGGGGELRCAGRRLGTLVVASHHITSRERRGIVLLALEIPSDAVAADKGAPLVLELLHVACDRVASQRTKADCQAMLEDATVVPHLLAHDGLHALGLLKLLGLTELWS